MALVLLPGLLRSILRMGGESDSDLLKNLNMLRAEVRLTDTDAHMVTHIGGIADRVGRVPDFSAVVSHYQHLVQQQDQHGLAGQVRLSDIAMANLSFWASTDYRYHLDRYKETVTSDTLGVLLQQTSTILSTGYMTGPYGKQVMLKGPEAASNFMETGLAALRAQFFTGDIEGSFRVDAGQSWDQYMLRKTGKRVGALSGFPEIDSAHRGLRRGDLALVLGYTSQFKSTLCFNWAYHVAIYQGLNVGVVPLEMSKQSLLDLLTVIHSYHPVFQLKYGDHGITLDAVDDASLTAHQEKIFQEVLKDLQTNTAYGHILYKEPQGGINVSEAFRWAEQQHRQAPLEALVVDYLGLMNAADGKSALRDSAVANSVIREAKQGAVAFDSGRGIALMSPWQSSREGFKEAEKSNGQYSLRACSWANEAERSSDLIYTTYIGPEEEQSGTLTCGNIKARGRKKIPNLFKLSCQPETGVIMRFDPAMPSQQTVNQSVTSGPKGAVAALP